jgi:hypothetical protein
MTDAHSFQVRTHSVAPATVRAQDHFTSMTIVLPIESSVMMSLLWVERERDGRAAATARPCDAEVPYVLLEMATKESHKSALGQLLCSERYSRLRD